MNEFAVTPPRAVRGLGWFLALVALAVLAPAKAEAQAQTSPSADAASVGQELQVFRDPSGVEIHVLPLRPDIGTDEMIDAFESAAQLLRNSRPATPVSHEEPGPPAPGTLPPPTTLPAPAPVEDAPPPSPAPAQTAALPTVAALACENNEAPADSHWYEQYHLVGLPATLLWQPPMANALQPRLALNMTSLKNDTTLKTIDTAIGGEVGFFRILPVDGSGLEFEPDFFAVVVSRFSNHSDFTAADFRFGFPLTFAYENWHAKIGYEHTSSHLGDDFIKDTGDLKQANIRDELVLGLDHVFADQLRLYGVFGYAGYINTPTPSQPERYDWGVEWSRNQTTDWRGQPFAALDMEFRGDQHLVADTTLQLGWQWKEMDTGRSFRTGVELYDGRSPYGQFYLNREKWVGFGVWIDF